MTETKLRLESGEVFKYEDRLFGFEVIRDEGMGEPWKEHDGHGIVGEWTRRGKAAGERVLVRDRESYRYYDVAGTMGRAKKEGWGIGDAEEGEMEKRLGRKPTKGEILVGAVEMDYEHLRDWCEDRYRSSPLLQHSIEYFTRQLVRQGYEKLEGGKRVRERFKGN
jgi:hypothetical protein